MRTCMCLSMLCFVPWRGCSTSAHRRILFELFFFSLAAPSLTLAILPRRHRRAIDADAVMAKRRVAVIGSLNVDFITRTPRVPAAGETLTASSFDTGFGGKGANQAVACARLASEEVEVQMVGNVGDDSFGADYCAALERDGVDTSTLRQVEGVKTGIANIIVEESTGENRIMLSTGANHAFSKECSGEWNMVPPEADVVVLQLEIPLPVVSH